MQLLLLSRLSLTRLAHLLSIIFAMLWVGVVWRGILINSFPANLDIALMIKRATESISLGMPYEFTTAMGSRVSYSALFFNPISFVQFFVGRADALWTGFVVLILLFGVGLPVLTRSARLHPISSMYGVAIFAVLIAVPSSFRVAYPEFGGSQFLLLYAIAPIIWGILRNLAGVMTHRITRRDAAFQLVLLWSLSSSGYSQVAVIWMVIIFAFGEALALCTASLRRALKFLLRVSIHGLLAFAVSSALFGSPILAILSSANSRNNSIRGASIGFDEWLNLNNLGTKVSISSVAVSAVVSLVLLWRSREESHRRFAYSAASVLGCLLAYVFAYSSALGVGFDLGPRPVYLTSWAATPCLTVLLGNLMNLSVSRFAVRARTLAPRMSTDVSLTAVAAFLPLLLMTMFSLKNPSVSADGVRLTLRVKLPEVLSADSILSTQRTGRVLILDEGDVRKGEAFQPAEVFSLTQNRELPEGVTLLTAHQHTTTRWQHYLFEGFGFEELPALVLYLYARILDFNLARQIGATHVISGEVLTDPLLTLLKTDISLKGSKRYLYSLPPTVSLPADSQILVSQESNPERATELALAANADGSEVVFVDRPATSLVAPIRSESRILRNRIELNLDSDGDSAIVLPIEFSSCHYLVQSSNSSGVATLLPLNGRFLGVQFSGKVTGEIRFRALGPRALACQFRDFLQTRHIG